jgi:heparin binding hemagglutinin HbhA
MAITAEIRKALTDSTPLYAVAGAGDLAVEKLREVPAKLAALKVEPKAVQDRVTGSLTTVADDVRTLPDMARTLPEKAQSFALAQVGKANDAYEDLAERGKGVVGRIRRQQATQDLKAQADSTEAKVKATVTTAKRAAASTERAAKGAVTSAGKTVKAAEKAAKDAADTIG